MKVFLSTIGRICALVLTHFVLVGCDGNPTENKPPAENTDRYVVFEPTTEVTPTSYYKGASGEFVTYGRLTRNPDTGSQEYTHTGLKLFRPQGSTTVINEDGGYYVVIDTEAESFSLAYRVRENATRARVEVYLINELTGVGMVIGDTVVDRVTSSAIGQPSPNRVPTSQPARNLLPDGICANPGALGFAAEALGYSLAVILVVDIAIAATAVQTTPLGWALVAFGGVTVGTVMAELLPDPGDGAAWAREAIDAAYRIGCPDTYADRNVDCPRCDESIRYCVVDSTPGSRTMCCESGKCNAEEPEYQTPPPNSSGDVHIRTPDGLAYDFQGAGEYLLMASSDGSVVVQSRQEPWRESDQATVNTAVAMRVAGDRVGVYLERSPQLVINGTPTPFNGGRIDLPNGGTVLGNALGYLIRWPDGFLVSVHPHSSFLDIGMSRPEGSSLSYSGLLGNMNGDSSDDFFARGGQRLTFPMKFAELYDVFGASWQVTQAEALFDYQAGESTVTFALPGFPSVPVTINDFDPDVYRSARDTCLAAGISNPVLLNDCIFDVGLTGESAFTRSAADAPAPERELDVNYPDGLIGSYYDGYFDDDLSFFGRNAPVLTRVDNPIDFRDDSVSWDLGGIPALADLESYSVVWKGRLVVPKSGTYTLYLNSDDASYLFLGEAARNPSTSNATINNGTAHPLREQSVEVRLEAGDHPLMIVYGEEARNNIVQFFWSSTDLGVPKQIVTALGRRIGH